MMACKLFIRMKMREEAVEKQVQQMLSYMQGIAADVQKENLLEDLETEVQEFEIVGEILKEI